MLRGYGWCLLRASPPKPGDLDDGEVADRRTDVANEELWKDFRRWMGEHPSPWLTWQFQEYENNDTGVLTFSVSRNHRASVVWEMLGWIAEHGPGSYGLFHVHDDEDEAGVTHYGRGRDDYSNVFRVHRLLGGEVTEFDDPFFGPIAPRIEPS